MPQRSSRTTIAFGIALLVLLGAYADGVWTGSVPLYPVALAYAAMSLLTFAVYRRDKEAEIAKEPQTPDATLHVLELFGGWPGAFLAQHLFKHKVREGSFQIVFLLIIVLHGAGWYLATDKEALRRTTDALPKSVTSLFAHLPKIDYAKLIRIDVKRPASPAPAPTKPAEPDAAPAEPESTPPPLADVWASDPATAPLIHEPGVRRSRVIVGKASRLLAGEVKAISPSHGLLVTLPPEIGGDGVIAPATLVADFHRRFSAGEKIVVAVKGVSMKGARKQLELVLVEP